MSSADKDLVGLRESLNIFEQTLDRWIRTDSSESLLDLVASSIQSGDADYNDVKTSFILISRDYEHIKEEYTDEKTSKKVDNIVVNYLLTIFAKIPSNAIENAALLFGDSREELDQRFAELVSIAFERMPAEQYEALQEHYANVKRWVGLLKEASEEESKV